MRQLLSTLCPVSPVCVGAYCIVSDLMGIEVKKGIQMLVFDTGNLLRAKRGREYLSIWNVSEEKGCVS